MDYWYHRSDFVGCVMCRVNLQVYTFVSFTKLHDNVHKYGLWQYLALRNEESTKAVELQNDYSNVFPHIKCRYSLTLNSEIHVITVSVLISSIKQQITSISFKFISNQHQWGTLHQMFEITKMTGPTRQVQQLAYSQCGSPAGDWWRVLAELQWRPEAGFDNAADSHPAITITVTSQLTGPKDHWSESWWWLRTAIVSAVIQWDQPSKPPQFWHFLPFIPS